MKTVSVEATVVPAWPNSAFAVARPQTTGRDSLAFRIAETSRETPGAKSCRLTRGSRERESTQGSCLGKPNHPRDHRCRSIDAGTVDRARYRNAARCPEAMVNPLARARPNRQTTTPTDISVAMDSTSLPETGSGSWCALAGSTRDCLPAVAKRTIVRKSRDRTAENSSD